VIATGVVLSLMQIEPGFWVYGGGLLGAMAGASAAFGIVALL
jgi:hypothetical protein